MTKRLSPYTLKQQKDRRERRTRWLIWAESALIFGLLVWVSIEYESNIYLQDWFKENIGPFGFLFNGTIAGIYAGAFIGYSLALFIGRKSEEEKILESLIRKDNATK